MTDRSGEKITMSWSFSGGTAIVVYGETSIITAYPTDGSADTWLLCAVS